MLLRSCHGPTSSLPMPTCGCWFRMNRRTCSAMSVSIAARSYGTGASCGPAAFGSVITREDSRRHGYASIALNAALQTLKDEGATDFALLFCEPHNAPFYMG